MTGRNHPEAIPEIIQAYADHAVESRPVAEMATVRTVSAQSNRCTIELLSDPNASASNVPIAVPFANDEHGDVLPIEPGTTGIALFLDHPVDEQLETGGTETEAVGMDIEDAVFLPACVTTDADDVPDHDRGDRIWEHPGGSRIEMRDEDDAVRLRQPDGAWVGALGDGFEDEVRPDVLPDAFFDREKPAEEDMTESERRVFEDQIDRTSYPITKRGDSAVVAEHPEGLHVTVTYHGVALGKDDRDAERTVVSGKPTHDDRVELDGRHQHYHLVEHGDDEYSLAGPPLTFREFLSWMTDSELQSKIRNADEHADAREYAENYLQWLEDEVGYELDPTDPDYWPRHEPMPTPDERDEFDPTVVGDITYL